MDWFTDVGRLLVLKPIFNNIPNFWDDWTDRPIKFGGIWGIFGQTINAYFDTVSHLSMIFKNMITKNPKYDIGHDELGK